MQKLDMLFVKAVVGDNDDYHHVEVSGFDALPSKILTIQNRHNNVN